RTCRIAPLPYFCKLRPCEIRIEAGRVCTKEYFPGLLGSDLYDQFVIALNVCYIRLDWFLGRRNQRYVSAAERAIDKRFLPPAGYLHHLIADPAERQTNIEPGGSQIGQQRRRVRAMLAIAIFGGCARPRSISNQRGCARRLDLAKTGVDRTRGRAGRPFHVRHERIVPAGVEDNESQSLRLVHRLNKALNQNSFVLCVAVAGEFGIDRNEIIHSADLDTVTSVIYDSDIGVDCRIFEIPDCALKILCRDVIHRHDSVKTSVAEKFGHGRCVLFRFGQPSDILIGGIADNQSNALVGKRGVGPKTQNDEHRNSGYNRKRWQILCHHLASPNRLTAVARTLLGISYGVANKTSADSSRKCVSPLTQLFIACRPNRSGNPNE